jgi:hypothetical protein
LQAQEKKLITEIKKTAKEGQMVWTLVSFGTSKSYFDSLSLTQRAWYLELLEAIFSKNLFWRIAWPKSYVYNNYHVCGNWELQDMSTYFHFTGTPVSLVDSHILPQWSQENLTRLLICLFTHQLHFPSPCVACHMSVPFPSLQDS